MKSICNDIAHEEVSTLRLLSDDPQRVSLPERFLKVSPLITLYRLPGLPVITEMSRSWIDVGDRVNPVESELVYGEKQIRRILDFRGK